MRLKRIDECAVNRNDELAHRDLLLMFLFVRFRSLRLLVSSAAPAPRRADCQDGASPAGANRPGGMC